MTKILLKDLVAPLVVSAFMALAFKSIYMQGSTCDVFLMLMIMGIPFGIGRMFLWFVPFRMDLGSTVAVLAFDVMIGGLIGIFILGFRILSSLVQLFMSISKRVLH